MKKNSRFIVLLSYAGVALIGAGLAFTGLPKSKYTSPNPPHINQIDSALAHNSPANIVDASTTLPLKPKTDITLSSNDEAVCVGPCQTMSTRLNDDEMLDDESFEALLGQIHELGDYLESNAQARNLMLKLAMTTRDDNKRALLIDIFTLLPEEQQDELGGALLTSENWRLRADGVKLSAASGGISPDEANSLFNTITHEPHSLVKTSILKTLKNSEALKGDKAVLNNLSIILHSETDSTVKSEALLTKLALEKDPINAIPEVMAALSSNNPEYQFSALIALDRIYGADDIGTRYETDHIAVKRKLEALMDIDVTDENEAAITRLLKEADAFYLRHF